MTQTEQRTRHYGFAMIPRLVIRGEKYKALSLLERGLYQGLKDICGETGECFYCLRNLAKELHTSISTLSRYIPKLKAVGLIQAEKKLRGNAKNKHEVWHITIVDIWAENDALYRSPNAQEDCFNEQQNSQSVSDRNKVQAQSVSDGNEDCFYLNAKEYLDTIDTLINNKTLRDTLGDVSLTANVTPPLAAETDNDSHDDTSNLPALFESLATAGDPIATDDVPTTEEQDAREQAETLRALVEAGVVQTTSPVSEPAVESVKLTEDAPSMSGECPVDAPQAFEQPMQETLMPEASAPQVALTEEEWLTERALHERKLLSLWKECKTGTRLKAQYATWVICRRAELAIWERSHKKPSKADALWAQLTPAEQEGVRRWHSLSRGAVITREDVEGAQLFTTSGVALTQEQMRDERDWLRENQQGWFGFAGTKRGRVSYRDLAEHAAGWFDALEHPVSALPPQQRGNGNLRIVKTNWDDPNFSIDDDFYPDEATKHARWAAQAAAAAR